MCQCISMTQIPERVCNCYHLSTACNCNWAGILVGISLRELHVIQRYQLNALFCSKKWRARYRMFEAVNLMRRITMLSYCRWAREKKGRLKQKTSYKWIAYCIISFICFIWLCARARCLYVCAWTRARCVLFFPWECIWHFIHVFSVEHMSTYKIHTPENSAYICFDLLSHRFASAYTSEIIIKNQQQQEQQQQQ